MAKRCSISCSCCNALTNAVLSRFVCSAFSPFFTFVVTHCSQIIFESLPTEKRNMKREEILNYAVFFSNILRFCLTWCILKCCVNSFPLFFPLPQRREINFALRAAIRLLHWCLCSLLFCDIIDNRFETEQINKFRIAWVRNKIHFWWWRLRWWNLQQSLFQLFS